MDRFLPGKCHKNEFWHAQNSALGEGQCSAGRGKLIELLCLTRQRLQTSSSSSRRPEVQSGGWFSGFTPLLKFLTVKILLSLAYFQKAGFFGERSDQSLTSL